MITRFGSLYAGHVDLDGHGFDAMPVNDRWLPDEHLASVFDKATAIATLMDRTGFDVMWLAEHHFQREGYECIPNILMLAVHLAHLTKRIKFGCGYHTREVETFGSPMLDQDANRELFEEQVDIIFKAFNERSFAHHGKHYDLPPRVVYRGYELE